MIFMDLLQDLYVVVEFIVKLIFFFVADNFIIIRVIDFWNDSICCIIIIFYVVITISIAIYHILYAFVIKYPSPYISFSH